jgi:plasmid stabilization system protein ParE
MTYRVTLSAKAIEELDAIVIWLARHSRAGAAKWLEAFEKSMEVLEQDPLRFALTPRKRFRPLGLREMRFSTPRGRRYRLVYLLEGRVVHVLHIFAPGQNQ